eukprot:1315672-Amphidinium_carterae.1
MLFGKQGRHSVSLIRQSIPLCSEDDVELSHALMIEARALRFCSQTFAHDFVLDGKRPSRELLSQLTFFNRGNSNLSLF